MAKPTENPRFPRGESDNEMKQSDQTKAKNGLGGMEDKPLGDNGYSSVKSKRPYGFVDYK